MSINVTDTTFDRLVIGAEGVVLVDLWAEWCAPCRAIAPVLRELEDDFGDALTVAKIDVDENPITAQRLGVRSIPTLLLFVGGKIVETVVGVQPRAALAELVNRHVNAKA